MCSLGNSSIDHQLFIDADNLILAPDWSKGFSDFENVIQIPFKFGL